MSWNLLEHSLETYKTIPSNFAEISLDMSWTFETFPGHIPDALWIHEMSRKHAEQFRDMSRRLLRQTSFFLGGEGAAYTGLKTIWSLEV